jgi:hypothetical protein
MILDIMLRETMHPELKNKVSTLFEYTKDAALLRYTK